jgi:RNA-splicing ligase RtcB
MHRNEIRHKGIRRKKVEMLHTGKRCFDKEIERLRAVMHRKEITHKRIRWKKKEMACTERRCFDKKIENVWEVSCTEITKTLKI